MPVIELTTVINAPIERCFDLSRSVDVHLLSTAQTHEKAIAGVTKGLMNKGEQVTWRAKHFGIYQKLTTLILEMDTPVSFIDIQLKGAFKKLHHTHLYEQQGEQTIMKDIFVFESPMGILGKVINRLILTNYMKRFLIARNLRIKSVAESNEWQKYLNK